MSEFEVQMPKLGESIQEATITKWFVKEGDKISEDDALFEVATEKVDSEIPSPVDGIISKILHKENDLVPVGNIVAVITLEGEQEDSGVKEEHSGAKEKQQVDEKADQQKIDEIKNNTTEEEKTQEKEHKVAELAVEKQNEKIPVEKEGEKQYSSGRFYSPLVKSIAKTEKVSPEEMENIEGSGQNGRVQKKDILQYLEVKKQSKEAPVAEPEVVASKVKQPGAKVGPSIGAGDQVIEMDRVRKLIAEHMVHSKHVAPHVTSVVEADVTNLVLWRQKVKDEFFSKYGEKLTFMPVFTEASAKALTEFPFVNSSVDGEKIYLHKNVNIGIAVAKPDGNLVVPVIRDAEQKNLLGLTKALNKLAEGARNNKLGPDDYQSGTFTITNFGSFRNIIGTPIINQPQVAILATGNIEKKPAVIETPTGDVIAIRHKMFLSLSYDHRVVDGALGGAFLRRIADILEDFDINRSI